MVSWQRGDLVFRELREIGDYAGSGEVLSIGSGIESAEKADALLAQLRQQASEFYLHTRRGSIAQNGEELPGLLARNPALQLALDLPELYLGHEGILVPWAEWRRLLQALAPRVAVLIDGPLRAERRVPQRGLYEIFVGAFHWLRRRRMLALLHKHCRPDVIYLCHEK